MSTSMVVRVLACLVVSIGSLACSGTRPEAIPVTPEARAEQLETRIDQLEQQRDASPERLDARVELASELYQRARSSLDRGDEAAYRQDLSRAQTELLEAIRIDPESPRPHTQMGIILAYQGDIEASRTSFVNALRLCQRDERCKRSANGFLYSNIAHMAVYRNKLSEARTYLSRGRKRGADPSEIDRIELLSAWKSGDLIEARDIFESAAILTPRFANTWDGAPLPKPMKTFADFTAVCCANPTCGPHMQGACRKAGQAVAQRGVTRETLVEEMRLERERRQKMGAVYKGRRDLSIEVDDPESTSEPSSDEPER